MANKPMLSGDDESYKFHQWDEHELECGVTFGNPNRHKHFIKCSRCGISRFGAFAEQGAWHYFTYIHPTLRTHEDNGYHEVVPPCTEIPSGFEKKDILICGKCHHITDQNDICRNCCDTNLLKIKGIVQVEAQP